MREGEREGGREGGREGVREGEREGGREDVRGAGGKKTFDEDRELETTTRNKRNQDKNMIRIIMDYFHIPSCCKTDKDEGNNKLGELLADLREEVEGEPRVAEAETHAILLVYEQVDQLHTHSGHLQHEGDAE